MKLSENIRTLRLKNNLTQEQLASSLGVSAQAVSKWETSETYPDGALFIPLANRLGVSLDELFGNNSASMADISKKILRLLHDTGEDKRFQRARDIGWQIERGLFNTCMMLNEEYNPEELAGVHNSSYILNDCGFTHVSNGRAPFFSVFLEPECGFGEIIGDGEEMRAIFEHLSAPETMRAIIFLYKRTRSYIFEAAVLASECEIEACALEGVINDLLALRVISKKELEINGERRMLFYSHPTHKFIALFLMAHELNYSGSYSLQSDKRSTPFLK